MDSSEFPQMESCASAVEPGSGNLDPVTLPGLWFACNPATQAWKLRWIEFSSRTAAIERRAPIRCSRPDAFWKPLTCTKEKGIGGGGIVEGRRVILHGLRLGNLDRRDIEGMALESPPLQNQSACRIIGLPACDYFQDSVLQLDFTRMTLSLQKP